MKKTISNISRISWQRALPDVKQTTTFMLATPTATNSNSLPSLSQSTPSHEVTQECCKRRTCCIRMQGRPPKLTILYSRQLEEKIRCKTQLREHFSNFKMLKSTSSRKRTFMRTKWSSEKSTRPSRMVSTRLTSSNNSSLQQHLASKTPRRQAPRPTVVGKEA